MLVIVSVNSLDTGGMQIRVSKPQANPGPVQTYATLAKGRIVLQAFGIHESEIDDTLKLLAEVGPNRPLRFSPIEIPQKILSDHAFRI